MFITCQNCNTRYSIPDAALRSKGRTLKCTKCGHKWFQSADLTTDEEQPSAVAFIAESLESRSNVESFHPPKEIILPTPPAEREPFSISFGATPPSEVEDAALLTKKIDPLDFDSAIDEKSEPEPISSITPDITLSSSFAPGGHDQKSVDFDLKHDESSLNDLSSTLNGKNDSREILIRKKSGLWWSCAGLVLVVLAGFGAYAFQQEIIHRWPDTAYFYEKTHLLQTNLPGAGLTISDQNVNWLIQDNNQSLVVRGTLVNWTTQSRPFPAMVFNLYSHDGKLRQTQTIPPFEDNISGGEHYQFRYVLPDPDPSTVAINISFITAVQPSLDEQQETPNDAVPDVTPSPN